MDLRLVTCRDLPGSIEDDRPLRDALTARGVAWELAIWDDPEVDWGAARAHLLRTTWDYFLKRPAFEAWCHAVSRDSQFWNPPAVVSWNSHKGYLCELADRGVATVPTRLLRAGAELGPEVDALQAAWFVLKPAVSAGAMGTRRFAAEDPEAALHLRQLLGEGEALLQPLVEEITSAGELSLLYVEGEYQHSVRKLPRPADFRVQELHGGRTGPAEPGTAPRAVAATALAAAESILGQPLLYARVDLVETAVGPVLMELELIEPELFLRFHPPTADRLADAVVRRLEAAS